MNNWKRNFSKLNSAKKLSVYAGMGLSITLLAAFQNCSGSFMGMKGSGVSGGVVNHFDANGQATFGNGTLTLVATQRLAGAVEMLYYNGKQFLNNYDHGRELQTSFLNNGAGECNNPTQAGNRDDATGQTSTSNLLSQSMTANTYTTVSLPAYWLENGESSANCPAGTVSHAVAPTADDQQLTTTIVVGAANDPNIVKYTTTVSNQYSHTGFTISSGLDLTAEFNAYFLYIPSEDIIEPLDLGSNTIWQPYPVVVSTGDAGWAVGSFAGDQNGQTAFYTASAFAGCCNGNDINYTYGALPAGDITHDNYLVIGALSDVSAKMKKVMSLTNSSLSPAVFDRALYMQITNSSLAADPHLLGGTAQWLATGRANGQRASAIYWRSAYLKYNPSLAQSVGVGGAALITDYLSEGEANGLRASLEYDPTYYLANHPKVASAVNGNYKAAARYWQMTGIDLGQAGSADFDPVAYLNRYPDLQAAFGATGYRQGLYHWITTGRNEGRIGTTNAPAEASVALNSSGAGLTCGSHYIIQNMASGQCLDVTAASTVAYTQLQQYDCVPGRPNQQFELKVNADGSYSFIAAVSGMNLDLDTSTMPSAKSSVWQAPTSGASSQNFILRASQGGGYELSSQYANNYCIQFPVANLGTNGVKSNAYYCTGAPNQAFTLIAQ